MRKITDYKSIYIQFYGPWVAALLSISHIWLTWRLKHSLTDVNNAETVFTVEDAEALIAPW